MQLLPDELRQQIPKLYSQETVKTEDKIVYAKFFFRAADWIGLLPKAKMKAMISCFSALSKPLKKNGVILP